MRRIMIARARRLPALRRRQRRADRGGDHALRASSRCSRCAALAIAVVGHSCATGDYDVAEDIVNFLGLHGRCRQDRDRRGPDRAEQREGSDRRRPRRPHLGRQQLRGGRGERVRRRVARGGSAVARSRLVGLGWLAGCRRCSSRWAASSPPASPRFRCWLVPLVLAVGLFVNTVLWLWTSWVLPNRGAPRGECSCPARSFGAVGLEALKIAGGYVVPMPCRSRRRRVYGTIGTVFALLTWLWLLGPPRGVRDRGRDAHRRVAERRPRIRAVGARCANRRRPRACSAADRAAGRRGVARTPSRRARRGSRPNPVGRGHRAPAKRASTSSTRASRSARLATTSLCADAHALTRLSRGRLYQYDRTLRRTRVRPTRWRAPGGEPRASGTRSPRAGWRRARVPCGCRSS